jgi:hypothetical protein
LCVFAVNKKKKKKSSPVKIGTMVTTKMVPPVSPPAASAASVVLEDCAARPSVTAASVAAEAVGLGTSRVVLNRSKKLKEADRK